MTSDLRMSIFAMALITSLCSDVLRAQSDRAGTAISSRPRPHFGNHEACVNCHFPKPGEQGVALKSKDFVQTTPATVWQELDKHRKAFTLLLDASNREIVRGMLDFDLHQVMKNGELDTESLQTAQLARLKQCLHCHAARSDEPDAQTLALDLGVSCQACHGPAKLWEAPHQLNEWRLISPREKERLHMTDVRNPIRRAKLCASCHVGDLQQQRFVTHEMYAKGHPPLPSFEPESFAVQMPPHWQKLPDKPEFRWWSKGPDDFEGTITKWLNEHGTDFDPATQQNVTISRKEFNRSYRTANFPDHQDDHDPRQDLPQVRGAIVAGAVVLQSYLNLLADTTDTATSDHRTWPEFAVFDCTACHHELRTGPLATGRPFRPSPPGRPPAPRWPMALARVGIVHLAKDSADANNDLASFDEQLRHIETAMTRQPFGDSGRVHAAAKELAASLETVAQQLERSRFDIPAAKRALRFLTDPQKHEIRDYHSARQLAWAIRQIAKDLATRGMDIETDKLFVGSNGIVDPLSLNLPAGQKNSVVDSLSKSLDAVANYDPDWFGAELQRIRETLAVE